MTQPLDDPTTTVTATTNDDEDDNDGVGNDIDTTTTTAAVIMNDATTTTSATTTTLSQPQQSHVPLHHEEDSPTTSSSSATESPLVVILIPPQHQPLQPVQRSRSYHSWLPKSWRGRSFGTDANQTTTMAGEAAVTTDRTHPHGQNRHSSPPTTANNATSTESKSVSLLQQDHHHHHHHHHHDPPVIGDAVTTHHTTVSSSSFVMQRTAASLIRHRARSVRLWLSATLASIPFLAQYTYTILSSVVVTSLLLGAILSPKYQLPHRKVAMIGNSMMYYNDFPRLMEELSDGHLTQNSCLHGNANFRTILQMGNGMFNIWDTGNARIFNFHKGPIHDFGACTVKQLLFGYDEALEERVEQTFGNIYYIEADDATEQAIDDATTSTADDDDTDDNNGVDYEKEYGDDYFSYNDGSNPCLRNPLYYKYLVSYVYSYHQNKDWDFILLNDNTRSPARNESRYEMLAILQDIYLPWFLETGAVPIFLATYGYWTPYRDMGGLGTVAQFTSLTMAGYQMYIDLLKSQLPARQQPRIAPVGLAFLLVWEENHSLWERLFHVDQIHSGPLGTYLQGLIVHHTIFGVLPKYSVAVRGDMSYLWHRARRFQPSEHHTDPFPTQQEAAYLYQIALRITVYKHVPKSFIVYKNGEASDYDPLDDIYKVDDLF